MRPFSYPVRCGSLAHILQATLHSDYCLLCLRYSCCYCCGNTMGKPTPAVVP
ncbi:MAG: hypothetical protein IKQ37_11895 [Bacteroidaceae bacterium]|nr:hypothetical protein [Bacteroidaceae bacterium]